jgi:phospholipid/cholesterol/gamma-HCH transport system substrate-binding protein
LAGVKIGSVSDMELDPETYMARTELTISNAIDIPDDSAVTVSSEGLLGGNFIEVVPGGSMYAFDPMTEIEDTQSSVSLTTLLMRFVGSAASGN